MPSLNSAENLVRRAAVVERPDQRLDDARGAVIGAHVGPAFQGVGERQMPGAARRRLVAIEPECAENGTAAMASPSPRSPGAS